MYEVIDFNIWLGPNGYWQYNVQAYRNSQDDSEPESLDSLEFSSKESAVDLAKMLAQDYLQRDEAERATIYVEGDEEACFLREDIQ